MGLLYSKLATLLDSVRHIHEEIACLNFKALYGRLVSTVHYTCVTRHIGQRMDTVYEFSVFDCLESSISCV